MFSGQGIGILPAFVDVAVEIGARSDRGFELRGIEAVQMFLSSCADSGR